MLIKDELILQVAESRRNYIEEVKKVSEPLSKWKADADSWSLTDITEHLFWAEQGGVLGMWKSVLIHREGKKIWEGEEIHKDLPIEDVIAKTWKDKETVPPIAAPRFGGPVDFWIISLSNLQNQLYALGKLLNEEELNIMTQPHPISGPLNMRQRFEFLRFHIDRHYNQVLEIRQKMNS